MHWHTSPWCSGNPSPYGDGGEPRLATRLTGKRLRHEQALQPHDVTVGGEEAWGLTHFPFRLHDDGVLSGFFCGGVRRGNGREPGLHTYTLYIPGPEITRPRGQVCSVCVNEKMYTVLSSVYPRGPWQHAHETPTDPQDSQPDAMRSIHLAQERKSPRRSRATLRSRLHDDAQPPHTKGAGITQGVGQTDEDRQTKSRRAGKHEQRSILKARGSNSGHKSSQKRRNESRRRDKEKHRN